MQTLLSFCIGPANLSRTASWELSTTLSSLLAYQFYCRMIEKIYRSLIHQKYAAVRIYQYFRVT